MCSPIHHNNTSLAPYVYNLLRDLASEVPSFSPVEQSLYMIHGLFQQPQGNSHDAIDNGQYSSHWIFICVLGWWKRCGVDVRNEEAFLDFFQCLVFMVSSVCGLPSF
jgi:hypothetical protein